MYRTRTHQEISLRALTSQEKELYCWLLREYEQSSNWGGFQNRTAHGIIEHAKRSNDQNWQNHPLYVIQLDLLGRVGIKSGELRGSLDGVLDPPVLLGDPD